MRDATQGTDFPSRPELAAAPLQRVRHPPVSWPGGVPFIWAILPSQLECHLRKNVLLMGYYADMLEARVAVALTLRQFDDDARRLGITKMVGSPAKERRYICESLSAFGGSPWPYSSTADNSWVRK